MKREPIDEDLIRIFKIIIIIAYKSCWLRRRAFAIDSLPFQEETPDIRPQVSLLFGKLFTSFVTIIYIILHLKFSLQKPLVVLLMQRGN